MVPLYALDDDVLEVINLKKEIYGYFEAIDWDRVLEWRDKVCVELVKQVIFTYEFNL